MARPPTHCGRSPAPALGTVGAVAFSGVEDLAGAAGNQDVFAFTATGSLAGVVAGGDGGWDTMRFDGGIANASRYLPAGPTAGRVLVGARTFDFVGLEPVTSNVTPERDGHVRTGPTTSC